jgi:hypothetical protein
MSELHDDAGSRRARRRLSLLAFGVSLVVLWCGGGATAFASSGGYAPPGLAIDDPSPAPDQTVTLSGTGCEPGSTVSFSLEPGAILLGTTTADANGRYHHTSTFPQVGPGTYEITATCGPLRTTTQVTVSSPAPDRPSVTRPPLAVTGAQVLGLVSIGAALLAVGGAALAGGRRWRRARA